MRFLARPTSLAHLRRRASEKKWPEARSSCERKRLNKGYVLRKKGKPDPTPARAEKRTAARFYQLKSGHAVTGLYPKSTDNRPDDHCWWCEPENISGTQQPRDHLFKHCSRWKDQQAELSRRPPRGRSGSGVSGTYWRMGCAARRFWTSCGVGRAAPPVEETWDSEDEGMERCGRVRRRGGGGLVQ